MAYSQKQYLNFKRSNDHNTVCFLKVLQVHDAKGSLISFFESLPNKLKLCYH